MAEKKEYQYPVGKDEEGTEKNDILCLYLYSDSTNWFLIRTATATGQYGHCISGNQSTYYKY